MTPEGLAHLVSRFDAARQSGEKIDPDSEQVAPATIGEGVRVALASMKGAPAAWKLGGTNQATREAFGVTEPYFGPLEVSEVFENEAVLDAGAYAAPLMAEPEIAVAFKTDFAPALGRRDPEALKAAIAWVAPAIELPATRLADPVRSGAAWLVADRCAAGALVIGERLRAEELPGLEAQDWVIRSANSQEEVGQKGLIGGVLGAVADTMAVFGRCGLSLPAGTVLACGGMTPAIFADGGRMELLLAERGGKAVTAVNVRMVSP